MSEYEHRVSISTISKIVSHLEKYFPAVFLKLTSSSCSLCVCPLIHFFRLISLTSILSLDGSISEKNKNARNWGMN